ncbi:MAG: 8-oxo-dGTP diphosphatase [Bacteroidota bacterium]|jgi:ADP-ribose pyrophosphatase YjhB (NUDIX family)
MPNRDVLKGDWLSNISVDCVIFGFQEKQLKVLLLKFKNNEVWTLPGGFIGKEEDADEAAKRVLWQRTGLEDIYLQQFHAFGDLKRNIGAFEKHEEINLAMGRSKEDLTWLSNRYITIGYYALVEYSKVQVTLNDVSDDSAWMDVDQIPSLFLDHNAIINKGLAHLRSSIDSHLAAFNLLPETFTMSELQQVYETILGKPIVRTNFQRKMLSLDILERIEKKYTGGAHKAPYLYRLDKKKAEAFMSSAS